MSERPSADSLMATVGEQVHALRKRARMTLQELGSRSGISVGLISQLERGNGNPSFNTLVQIAHALDVPVARLLQAADGPSPVVRRHERRQLDIHQGPSGEGAVHELLTPDLNRALEVVWVEVPAGYDTKDTPFTHAGEEVHVLLEGQHEVYLDGMCYRLEAGDAIAYASSIPHWYRNPGPAPVKLISIITPPTF